VLYRGERREREEGHTSMDKKNECVAVYSSCPAKSQTDTEPCARLNVLRSIPTVLTISDASCTINIITKLGSKKKQ
jgi:hypothetical protein